MWSVDLDLIEELSFVIVAPRFIFDDDSFFNFCLVLTATGFTRDGQTFMTSNFESTKIFGRTFS